MVLARPGEIPPLVEALTMPTLSSIRAGHTRVARSIAVSLSLLLGGVAITAADRNDEQKRITDSTAVIEALVRAPDQGIPDSILDSAEAIVVIPSLVKGGFII